MKSSLVTIFPQPFVLSHLEVASPVLDPRKNKRTRKSTVVFTLLHFTLSCRASESKSFLVYFVAESREIPDITDTISRPPDTPLYHVLEGPDRTDTIRDQALSVHYEQSSERFRSDSDYDEPALKEARAAIGSPSKGREKEPVYEDPIPKRLTDAASSSDILDDNDEYCYSYTTAVQNVPLKHEKSRPHEGPKTDGSFYHSLEGPNAGYQALEGTPAATNGYTPMEGITELSSYQLLQKSTRSVYQPLRKTTESPRRAFTKK